MSHLKIINTGQNFVHKYENLKRKCTIVMRTFSLTGRVL